MEHLLGCAETLFKFLTKKIHKNQFLYSIYKKFS